MIDCTNQLRAQILYLAGEYSAEKFAPRPFVPGESSVPVSGKVFDASEMRMLVDSALDFWRTAGRFEREFARWFGLRACSLTNSGSPANLLAISAPTSPKLGDRLAPRDEVITAPVFVDGIARRESKMEIPILAGYYVRGNRRTLHHAEIGQAPLTSEVEGGNRGAP